MAELIPGRSTCLRRMTGGEKRFSERLERKLDVEQLCWYDVPIGPKLLRPDFIVVDPQRGFLILEVKDWRADTVREADRTRIRILGDVGLVTVSNPLEQARIYALEVDVLLRQDPALRNPPSHPYAGKLVMPWGYGVVLSNITRKQFDGGGLGQVIDPHRVICADEMLADVDAEQFQARLWAMFPHPFPCRLSLPQIDRIRWHLFPELRVHLGNNQFGLFDSPEAVGGPGVIGKDGEAGTIRVPDLIKVMDRTQEQLARSLGDGHRVIHGVAGSGKTMILGYRCLQMAQATAKPILVLCFNVALAARLQWVMQRQGIAEKVVVCHFHEWCKRMMRAFNVSEPTWVYNDFEGSSARRVQALIRGVEIGQVPRAQYGAIMIDEGHDFEPEWLRLIVQMLDPVNDSLLLLYDDAQNINRTKSRSKFTFKSVGIQAVGRTTILKLNYRNTFEVLSIAQAFAKELLRERGGSEDDMPIVAPESAGRRGALPEITRLRSPDSECAYIAVRVLDEIEKGRSASDIAIVYREKRHVPTIKAHLARLGIAFRTVDTKEEKLALFSGDPSVKLVTMHSSKGLEFHSVYVPGLGMMPGAAESEEDEARLLYVAMTRATDRLAMTYSGSSQFVDRLLSARAGVSQQLADA